MNKELEEAIKKSLSNKERGTCVISVEILEEILNYIDNSISKEVIEEKIEEIKKMLKDTTEGKLQRYTAGEIITIENFLQELLEGK